MRLLVLLLCLGWAPNAAAFTSPKAGLDLSIAAGYSQRTDDPGAVGALSAVTWFGKFDEDYSLGRYLAIGATGQVQTYGNQPCWTALGEFRRGLILIAVNTYAFANVGASQLADGPVTPALRIGGGAAFRPHVKWSAGVRLEVGADIEKESVPFRLGLSLTGHLFQPFSARKTTAD